MFDSKKRLSICMSSISLSYMVHIAPRDTFGIAWFHRDADQGTMGQRGSVQNPSVIQNEILVNGIPPFLDCYNPQYIKGSIIPELIINQQGF